MGVRLTGISTPVCGVSWEYTKAEERSAPLPISPGQKIKVFISSICGVEKYDKVRAELKKAIERTQLVDVYTFESRGASNNVVILFAERNQQLLHYLLTKGIGETGGIILRKLHDL